MDVTQAIQVNDWFDATAVHSVGSHYFPFPEIVTPIMILIGILVAAKVTSAVLKMVTGGLSG